LTVWQAGGPLHGVNVAFVTGVDGIEHVELL
jgi:hypothetical protein